MNERAKSQFRTNKASTAIIEAIDKTSKEYPELTNEEVGLAMLKLLQDMAYEEIKSYTNLK